MTKTKTRVVIDTNVLISAVFWGGKPKKLLNKVRREDVVFLTSDSILDELKSVLIDESKPFQLNEVEAEKIISALRQVASIILPSSKVSICRDEDDNKVLECALDGRADYIVTGDKDLLDLASFESIEILKLSQFFDTVE